MTACAHFLMGWALWSLATAPQVPALVAPLWVALVRAEAPRPEPEPPKSLPRAPAAIPAPPLVTPLPPPAIVPIAANAPPVPATPADPAAAPPAVAAVEAVAPVVAPPPRPTPPPPPRLLRADQVRYLVLPPAEMPLLSRRAGESGVVWLRVRIDALGRPSHIALHRSSGFRRLDEQALAAMAQARFAPALEDGVAVEVEVIAPVEYAAE